ncbi:hypothetical protein MBSD_n0763 [Mizugakiibacter sediminis]|uniref:Uncharacterized protein n=2 Tax=Mizugakiibacter sediminis TaxID=1475481 RepID=A0A0K8QKT6_9GAMM|nr:hypothetical protein [Mizugakiibacter sediminis]GAP65473.1 hypothetical protein MBSD_n0763 [Mizugakiibacter sediminis]
MRMLRCAQAAMMAGMLAPALAAAAPWAAWEVPAGYREIAGGDHERIYVRADEDAKHPAERLEVRLAEAPAGQPLGDWFAALRKQREATCPQLQAQPGRSRLDAAPPTLLEMWHCPRDARSGKGEVAVLKAMRDGTRVWLASASRSYAPFEPGKTPLQKAELARWTAFEQSLTLCLDYASAPACMGDPAALGTAQAVAPAAAEAAALHRAEARGREIYLQDRLAWKAGDVLGKAGHLGKDTGVKGWIAMPGRREGGTVYFLGGSAQAPVPLWVVAFDASGKASVRAARADDLERDDLAARYRARQSALALQAKPCTPALGSAVLRPEDGQGWLVYTLAHGADADTVWIGGHTRFRMAPDAVTALDAEPLPAGCQHIARHDADGRAYRVLQLAQPQPPVPSETLIAQQLGAGLPFLVATPAGVWRIDDGRVQKLDVRARNRLPAAH